jgi:DNA-binding CsgD family transcriptional regulator/Tfp pilus assembly protein PilF
MNQLSNLKYQLLILLMFTSIIGFTQNPKIDSLSNRLNEKLSQKEKITTLHSYVWELAFYSPQDAIEPAKQSLNLSLSLNDSSLIANSYNRIGLVHDYAGNFSLAEKNYLKAYAIKRLCDGENKTDGVLNNLGSIYYYMGDFEKSMDYYLQSLKIREAKKDKKDPKSVKNVAQSYNNIGLLLKSQKNYGEAVKYYTKALTIKKELNDVSGLITTYSNLGVVFMELDSLTMAEHQFNDAVFLSDSIGDYVSKAMLFNNIGLLYNRTSKFSKAEYYYTQSVDLYEKIEDLHGKSTALINLSSIYLDQGKNSKAEKLAEEALEIGSQSHAPNVTLSALKLLSLINSKNQPKKALAHLNEYIILKDSITDISIANKINQLAVMYETEKKETEIDLLKNEQLIIQSENERKDILISRNKTYLIILVIGLILIVVLGYIIILYLQSKKRIAEEQSQKMHEQQQREIDQLRHTLERQVEFPESKEIKINQTELNEYLLNPLTERELDVLYLIANGSTNKIIGEKLFISVNTVKTHVLKIYEKLDVKNRTAAASKANSLNIIQ